MPGKEPAGALLLAPPGPLPWLWLQSPCPPPTLLPGARLHLTSQLWALRSTWVCDGVSLGLAVKAVEQGCDASCHSSVSLLSSFFLSGKKIEV